MIAHDYSVSLRTRVSHLREPIMELNNLQDLLVEDLKDLYNAESQIIKALPRMIKAASNDELRSASEESPTPEE